MQEAEADGYAIEGYGLGIKAQVIEIGEISRVGLAAAVLKTEGSEMDV